MHDYLRRIGYQPEDLNKLNVVHITGTKGKGSTSAFVERMLRDHLPGRIGLYTSPHLCAVRERIRINGRPLEEEEFAKYFFEVWERLEADPKVSPGMSHCLLSFSSGLLLSPGFSHRHTKSQSGRRETLTRNDPLVRHQDFLIAFLRPSPHSHPSSPSISASSPSSHSIPSYPST